MSEGFRGCFEVEDDLDGALVVASEVVRDASGLDLNVIPLITDDPLMPETTTTNKTCVTACHCFYAHSVGYYRR